MSNYKCKVRIKATGEIKEVAAIDNHFGLHDYGYIDNSKSIINPTVYRASEVEEIPEKKVESRDDGLDVEKSALIIKQEMRIVELEQRLDEVCEKVKKLSRQIHIHPN